MEIAFRMGNAVGESALVTRDDAVRSIDSVACAFELIDDRYADYARLDAYSLVADNSWNAGAIFGREYAFADCHDLLAREGRFMVNGREVDKGLAEDAGGDPVDVVVWLATMLRSRGLRLEPGQWIMTGSLVPTYFPVAGDECRFEVDGLGSVELTLF
jgi:2-keto-4-pentenoate hydratase